MPNKIRVNISITEETQNMLKKYAIKTGTNVSQVVTNLIWKECEPIEWGNSQECSRIIRITADTDERLQQWAYENHTTVDQAITDWIWKQKVKDPGIKGQICIF